MKFRKSLLCLKLAGERHKMNILQTILVDVGRIGVGVAYLSSVFVDCKARAMTRGGPTGQCAQDYCPQTMKNCRLEVDASHALALQKG